MSDQLLPDFDGPGSQPDAARPGPKKPRRRPAKKKAVRTPSLKVAKRVPKKRRVRREVDRLVPATHLPPFTPGVFSVISELVKLDPSTRNLIIAIVQNWTK